MSIKKGIGYSPFTDKVYIGKQNKVKGMWVGEKEDITNDFINISFQYFEEGTVRQIDSADKENLFINIVNSKYEVEKLIKNLTKRLEKL